MPRRKLLLHFGMNPTGLRNLPAIEHYNKPDAISAQSLPSDALLVQLDHAHFTRRRGLHAEVAEDALVLVLLHHAR